MAKTEATLPVVAGASGAETRAAGAGTHAVDAQYAWTYAPPSSSFSEDVDEGEFSTNHREHSHGHGHGHGRAAPRATASGSGNAYGGAGGRRDRYGSAARRVHWNDSPVRNTVTAIVVAPMSLWDRFKAHLSSATSWTLFLYVVLLILLVVFVICAIVAILRCCKKKDPCADPCKPRKCEPKRKSSCGKTKDCGSSATMVVPTAQSAEAPARLSDLPPIPEEQVLNYADDDEQGEEDEEAIGSSGDEL